MGIHRLRTGTSPRGEVTELRSIGGCPDCGRITDNPEVKGPILTFLSADDTTGNPLGQSVIRAHHAQIEV